MGDRSTSMSSSVSRVMHSSENLVSSACLEPFWISNVMFIPSASCEVSLSWDSPTIPRESLKKAPVDELTEPRSRSARSSEEKRFLLDGVSSEITTLQRCATPADDTEIRTSNEN
nr:hypothetical protein Iba_chr04aCG23170 [Ipomoea batatas]